MFIPDPTDNKLYESLTRDFRDLDIQYSSNNRFLDCSEFSDSNSCSQTGDCYWENNVCFDKCSIYNNENDCLVIDGCSWFESDKDGDSCSISKDLGDIRISFEWYNEEKPEISQDESINNDWRVEITPKDNKGAWLPYGYRTTTKRIPFYDKSPTVFKGENFYKIKFDKLEKENDGLVTLGFGGAIILLLLLF